ncbi:MAG: nickel-dependent hydrogenase large subunit [Candidatus Bipolaricaulota bacterium]|nr:MAG: nickel-dependent hydrogenase large subunit [Candidatus Bipolaricaulota bacterium]
MRSTIVIDPITRIEGHLKVEAVVEDGVVREARSTGTLFRGLELILRGRDPRDAPRVTQRICGVCPTAHATASSTALDQAFGIAGSIPDNGRIERNLIFGCNYLQSHILHFYHLAALDYVDVTAAAGYQGSDSALQTARRFLERGEAGPFVPRYEGDYRLPDELSRAATAHYVQALDIRRRAHEMLAVFGGKMPHNVGIVPGGVTQVPEVDTITQFLWRLNEIRTFIDGVYLPDVLAVAEHYGDHAEIGGGCRRYIDYGGFPLADGMRFAPGTMDADSAVGGLDAERITESIRHAWYEADADPLPPSRGETHPKPGKEGGYSWVKAPRYDGKVHEGGPLARVLLAYSREDPVIVPLVDDALRALGADRDALHSALGRHLARAIECKVVADAMAEWVLELAPGEPVYCSYELPEEGEGAGLVAAPRGALGHWVRIEGGRIAHYQCVVPTTWNASPMDDAGEPGPMEQALLGTPVRDPDNPFEIVRIVRSFDPCLACAVHVIRRRSVRRSR